MTKPSRVKPTGAKSVRGSDAARRLAALLLEAWSGVRSTQSAADAMGVAVTRFYQLEARALQSLVEAMEPRARGRQRTHASEIAKLKADKQRLSRDVERFQSLYRTSQRALGIAVAKPPEKGNTPAPGGKRKRGPRKRARGQAVAAELLGNAAVPEALCANVSETRVRVVFSVEGAGIVDDQAVEERLRGSPGVGVHGAEPRRAQRGWA